MTKTAHALIVNDVYNPTGMLVVGMKGSHRADMPGGFAYIGEPHEAAMRRILKDTAGFECPEEDLAFYDISGDACTFVPLKVDGTPMKEIMDFLPELVAKNKEIGAISQDVVEIRYASFGELSSVERTEPVARIVDQHARGELSKRLGLIYK